MDSAIIAAMIAAVATIITTLVTILVRRERKAKVRLIDTSVIGQPKQVVQIIKGEILDCRVINPWLKFPYQTDPLGVEHFFPIIDFKFKNSGDDVAFLKRMEFEILDVTIDTTPLLEFYIAADKEDNLVITVKNCGWGPALNVKLNNLQHEDIRECLELPAREYFWEGKIEVKEVVDIVFPKNSIKKGANKWITEPCGYITYEDLEGNEYGRMVRYDPYPFEEYKVGISDKGFTVEYQDWARAREPSYKYNIILPTEPKKYSKVFNIAHQIDPIDTERFQVVVAAEKSATFKFVIRIYFDENGIVQTKPMQLKVYNPNELWYYSYLKSSRGDRNLPLFGRHKAGLKLEQEFIDFYKKQHPEVEIDDGESYPEVFLYGEQIMTAKNEKQQEGKTEKYLESEAWAFNDIGWTLIEEDINVDEGLRLTQKALGLKPNEPFILDTLGWGYYKKGLYKEAFECFQKAIQGAPEDEIIKDHLEKARSAMEQNKMKRNKEY